jgi:5-methylthioadenosine/S-adenosylhomocysteine deaminase
LYHVVSQLIYAASRRQVSDVWVDGKRLLDHGELTTIDLDTVINSARQWQSRLAGLDEHMMGKTKESTL